ELPRSAITIVYAILDEKHEVESHAKKTTELFYGNLSLFAKIDLLSRVQMLRGLGYFVALSRIRPYPQKDVLESTG
ncbi:MAG: hypothetical protein MI749_01105, partial [Desulfovibrionales bacterium]|nr:hypothetical protein [Desulfovibrionales bacterium]